MQPDLHPDRQATTLLDDQLRGRDIDRVYLDGVIQRAQATLRLLVHAMSSAQETEVQYFIQQTAPVILHQLDRAEALRATW